MNYLFWAYFLLWVGTLGYVVSIARKNEALRREVDALEHMLKERGGTTPS